MARPFPDHCRSMAFQDWPEPDRSAWIRAISPGTALLDAGLGAGWREPTRERYDWVYGHWLTFMECQGLLDRTASPGDRVTQSTVAAFVDSLRARDLASRTVASYVQALYCAVRAMVPETDGSWLKQIVTFLNCIAQPMQSDPSRLHDIDDVYWASLKSMDRADRMVAKRPIQDSIWFRDGLIVAIGAATALRRTNLACLDLDRHLSLLDDGWCIDIAGNEMKTGKRYEGSVPESLTPYLERYLSYHRPRLLQGQRHSGLFIRHTGDPFTVNTLSHLFNKITKRLGFPMSCHDLRRSTATTIAEKYPEFAWMIRDVLVHNGTQTGDRHYNRARMVLSSRRYGDTMTKLRARLRKSGKALVG